jgi:MFS family permease
MTGYSKEVWVLSLVTVLTAMSGGTTLTPILPDLKATFRLSLTGTALIVSSANVARTATDLPAGVLIDRLSSRTLLVGGGLVSGAGAALSALAFSFPTLIAGQLIYGIGRSACLLAAMAAFADLASEKRRGGLFGLYSAAVLIGSFIGPLVSGELASEVGWRAAFVYSAVAATGTALLAFSGTRTRRSSDADRSAHDGQQSTVPNWADQRRETEQGWAWRRAVPIFAIVLLLFTGSTGMGLSAIPVYASESLFAGARTIGLAVGLSMLVRSVVSLLGGHLGDRVGHRRVVIVGLMILGLAFVSFDLIARRLGLLPAMLFTALGHLGTALPNAWLVDLSPRTRWGTSLGIGRLVADLAHVLGPMLVAYAFEWWSFSAATVVAACLVWAAALVAATVAAPPRRRPSAHCPR